MIELKTMDEVLLGLIAASKKFWTTSKLHEVTGYSVRNIQKSLQKMHEGGLLEKVKAEKNTWMYGATETQPSFVKKDFQTEEKPVRKQPKKVGGIDRDTLEKFLRHMSKSRWKHPLFTKEIELNRLVLSLYSLAFEAGTGGLVTEQDLINIKVDLQELLRLFMTYVDLLSAIIEQDRLWDPEVFAGWLSQNYTAMELRDMVTEARKHN